MNVARISTQVIAALAAACISSALAEPGDFRLQVDSSRPSDSEDKAVQGYVLLQPGASDSRAVGTIGRAFSLSALPGNSVRAVAADAENMPTAQGNVVGIESAVANLAAGNIGELRGIDIVFKNRGDEEIMTAVPFVGHNRFNESSSAVYISSQPRSPAGEYSGWQAGIKFGRSSLDRSSGKSYATAIDVSDVEVDAAFYLVVWRCGFYRCGLKLTNDGPVTVTDIDRVP